jgi:hypothetical protein
MIMVVEWGDSGTNRKIQYPVYFISEVLSDSKTRYFHIMKLAYTLLITSCKLSHYFQPHQIEVHTSSTLGEILNNREVTGKIEKWAIELSMYDIYLQASDNYHGSSTKWLHGRVDGDSDTAQRKRAGVLDHQLWWILTTSSCKSRNTGNISQRGKLQVCFANVLSNI